jgi:hypothetical protein
MTSSSGGSTPAWQKENVSFPMMNIEINATMKEHDRQKECGKTNSQCYGRNRQQNPMEQL